VAVGRGANVSAEGALFQVFPGFFPKLEGGESKPTKDLEFLSSLLGDEDEDDKSESVEETTDNTEKTLLENNL
jgi:hypothetical protein